MVNKQIQYYSFILVQMGKDGPNQPDIKPTGFMSRSDKAVQSHSVANTLCANEFSINIDF